MGKKYHLRKSLIDFSNLIKKLGGGHHPQHSRFLLYTKKLGEDITKEALRSSLFASFIGTIHNNHCLRKDKRRTYFRIGEKSFLAFLNEDLRKLLEDKKLEQVIRMPKLLAASSTRDFRK